MKTQLLALLGAGTIAGAMAAAISSDPMHGVVVHEWGTFTDVQGPDGKQMIWTPPIAPDLPKFVYNDRWVLGGKMSKGYNQRMETPVLYFYSDGPRTMDVAVNFPTGSITEWYPLKDASRSARLWSAVGRAGAAVRAGAAGESEESPLKSTDGIARKIVQAGPRAALEWKHVDIVPSTPAAEAALLNDGKGSHYYAARETDAALVRVNDGERTETEKFLFYRGVALFEAPLTVTMSAEGAAVTLRNTGAEPLRELFLSEIAGADGRWVKVPALAPGEARTVPLPTGNAAPLAHLAAAMRHSLVTEGLYPKEAAAMVKTWESSWFGEPGLRVLYTLPRAFTDRTLPLQLSPAPERVERVMVARAEIISPRLLNDLRTLSTEYRNKPAEREAITARTRALGRGRFLESAFELIMEETRDPEARSLLWELCTYARQPVDPRAPTATTAAR